MGMILSSGDMKEFCNLKAYCPSWSPCCNPEDDEKPMKGHVTIIDPDGGPGSLSSESLLDFTEDMSTPTSSIFNIEIRPALEEELKRAEAEQGSIKRLQKTIKLPRHYKFVAEGRYGLIRYSASTDHWYAAPDRMDRIKMQNMAKQEEAKAKQRAKKRAETEAAATAAEESGGRKKPWQRIKRPRLPRKSK